MVTLKELMDNPCKVCGKTSYDFKPNGELFRTCGHLIEKELQ